MSVFFSKATVVMLCLAFLLPSSRGQTSESQCLKCENMAHSKVPKYLVAYKMSTAVGGLMVYASIRKDQFTADALSALACRLARDFSNDQLLVLVFDNFDSAKRFRAPWQEEKPAGWQKHVQSWRATYSRDVQKHENRIWWYVDPEKTQQKNSTFVQRRQSDLALRTERLHKPRLTTNRTAVCQRSGLLPG